MPILRVFVDKDDRPPVLQQSTLIEPYDAFLLVQATPAGARRLARKYPVEDITDHYQVHLPNKTLNTARPRITTAGKVRHPLQGGAALAGPASLSRAVSRPHQGSLARRSQGDRGETP
jgi:hypothetical protein